jgi:DNA-binding transcriptional regulator YiaG
MSNVPLTDTPASMVAAAPPVTDDQLGGVIRYLRQQLGMTQEELAQALGITVGTVSRWEKGRFRPSRLARALILDFARAHNVAVELKGSVRHA